jgi:hypothetical protein
MIDILMFLPPQAQLSISLDDYKTFLEIAKQDEQQRIIKLLEDRTNDSGSVLDETGNSIADLSDLIELIKGETNV